METQLIIDGRDVPAASGATFERRSPVTDAVVTRAAAAGVADAVAAADSAAKAFKSWSRTGPRERRRILLKAADLLEAKLPDFVRIMAAEIGASQLWAGFNVKAAADKFREAASLTTQIQGETIPTERPETLSMTIRQPVGVILSVVPWNGPVPLAARAIVYPLACGNTVVFRASESSPKTHALLVDVLHEAGLPPGCLNMLTNAPEDAPGVIETLIEHPAIRRINFTGSTRVGRIVAAKAGEYLKPCLLELGGKSPMIVLDDADLDEAAKAAVFGCFFNQGQICLTSGRVIVDEKIADAFVEKFVVRARKLVSGDPAAEGGGVIVGPLITRASVERVEAMLRQAVDRGADILLGGRAEGAVLPPTIVDHVTPQMQLYEEEAFAPIATIIRARDTEDAVQIANDTEYGLSGAVFGHDTHRALQVALRIEAGCCHVNGATVQGESQAPLGGMKASGYGRFDGRAVINEFTELRWITISSERQNYPI